MALGTVAIFVLADRRAVIDALLRPTMLMAFLFADAFALVYHLWAIADAYALAAKRHWSNLARRPRGSLAAVLLVVVLVATASIHVAIGSIDLQAQTTVNCVFRPDAPCFFPGGGYLEAGETLPIQVSLAADATATAGAYVNGPDQSDAASQIPAIPYLPAATMPAITAGNADWRADGKLVVLLVGADASVGKWALSPDAMILLEVDIATGRAALYGIPRDLKNVPLGPDAADAYPCHCFPAPNPLNWLWLDAVAQPSLYRYQGSDFVRGFKALEGAVGALTKLTVDGLVVIDLMGFVHLVDALFPNGVTVSVPAELRDDRYSEPQDRRDIAIDIKPGVQQMDGLTALAYARSRHQNSNQDRMVRQQTLLVAMHNQLDLCALVPRIPTLLNTVGRTFWTDMALEDAPVLLDLMEHVGTANLKGYELSTDLTGATDNFLTPTSIDKIRDVVAHGLDGIPTSGVDPKAGC
jgi:LCP family protein required for cell wall assembly